MTNALSKTYRQVHVEQRSDLWFKWKQWKLGSSYASTIIGDNPFENIEMLYQRIVEGHEIEVTYDMQRGIDSENDALLLLNDRIKIEFKPACFEMLEYRYLIASLDGWSENTQTALEIKSPRKFSKEIEQHECPKKYYAQLQHILMVTGSDDIYYGEYVNGDCKYTLIDRNDDYISKLLAKEKEFFERLMTFSKPVHEFDEEWSKLS